jgi:ribosomal protein L32
LSLRGLLCPKFQVQSISVSTMLDGCQSSGHFRMPITVCKE